MWRRRCCAMPANRSASDGVYATESIRLHADSFYKRSFPRGAMLRCVSSDAISRTIADAMQVP